MHLERRTTLAMERTSSSEFPTSSEAGVTTLSINLDNMTLEEIMEHFNLLDNLTQNHQPEDLDMLQNRTWRIAIIVIYSIVILFGFLENVVIVCVLLKNRHLHTPTNIFILGLSFSDILLCSFNLPFQLHQTLTGQWMFGAALCKVIISTYGIPVFVSSMSILMIAIDRYMLIVHPFRRRMSKMTAVLLILSIAAFTTFLAIPLMVFTEYEVINEPALRLYKSFCAEKWPSLRIRHVYTVSMILIQFFFPLITTSLVYIQISQVLKKRPIKKNEKRKNHKTNKILISIVLIFLTCWLPWNTFGLIMEFKTNLVPTRYIGFLDSVFRIFAMGSACINPFLYGWLNDNFRKELDIMVKRPGRNRIRQNGHTYTLAEHSKTEVINDKITTAAV